MENSDTFDIIEFRPPNVADEYSADEMFLTEHQNLSGPELIKVLDLTETDYLWNDGEHTPEEDLRFSIQTWMDDGVCFTLPDGRRVGIIDHNTFDDFVKGIREIQGPDWKSEWSESDSE